MPSRKAAGGRRLKEETKTTRRSDKEIIHDVISAADGGAKKTTIMYGCRLNPRQLSVHIGRLIVGGFLERDADKGLYSATTKGRRYIKAFERCSETRQLLAEQERALDAFWGSDEEARTKEAAIDNHARGKHDLR